MKSKIAKSIYYFLLCIDIKMRNYSKYSYETAPYCGHHFDGHYGLLTSSRYHEGMGGCDGYLAGVNVQKNSEEELWTVHFKWEGWVLRQYATNLKHALDE